MAEMDSTELFGLLQRIENSTTDLVFEFSLQEASGVEMSVRLENDPLRCFSIRYWCSDVVLFETDNGFTDFRFCEQYGDLQELESCIRELIDVGHAYLTQRPEPKGRFFPEITLTTATGEVALHRSWSTDLHNLFRLRGR